MRSLDPHCISPKKRPRGEWREPIGASPWVRPQQSEQALFSPCDSISSPYVPSPQGLNGSVGLQCGGRKICSPAPVRLPASAAPQNSRPYQEYERPRQSAPTGVCPPLGRCASRLASLPGSSLMRSSSGCSVRQYFMTRMPSHSCLNAAVSIIV